jgi:hypothetical protein
MLRFADPVSLGLEPFPAWFFDDRSQDWFDNDRFKIARMQPDTAFNYRRARAAPPYVCSAFSIGKIEIRELESILYGIFDAAVRVTDGRTSA